MGAGAPSVGVSLEGTVRLFRGWIYPVLCIRTEDIYLAAGLDAVVMLKTIEFGVQLFVPMAVVCLAVCAPLTPCLPDAVQLLAVLYIQVALD